MADNDTSNARAHELPRPTPALRYLDVMVGTWEAEQGGGSDGRR